MSYAVGRRWFRGAALLRGSGQESTHHRSGHLATPNYSYEKRQRELAKKRKAEEKRQRKGNRTDGAPGDVAQSPPGPAEPSLPTGGSTPTT